jgi:hypothetical protein
MPFEAPDYNSEQPLSEMLVDHDTASDGDHVPGTLPPDEAENAGMYDAYVTTDVLPTEEAAILTAEGEIPEAFVLPERRRSTYQLMHFIGEKAVAGEHPDHNLDSYMKRYKEIRARQYKLLDAILEDPTCRENSNEELYAKVRGQLTADFGQYVGDEPITLLTPEGNDRVCSGLVLRHGGTAANILGRIVVFKNHGDAYEDALIGLHEGAHFSAVDVAGLVVLRPIETDEQPRTTVEQ